MFTDERKKFSKRLWFLRCMTTLALVISIYLMLNPVAVVLSFIPYLSGLLSTMFWVVSVILGVVIALLVTALAWVVYHPEILGSVLLGIGLVLFTGGKTTATVLAGELVTLFSIVPFVMFANMVLQKYRFTSKQRERELVLRSNAKESSTLLPPLASNSYPNYSNSPYTPAPPQPAAYNPNIYPSTINNQTTYNPVTYNTTTKSPYPSSSYVLPSIPPNVYDDQQSPYIGYPIQNSAIYTTPPYDNPVNNNYYPSQIPASYQNIPILNDASYVTTQNSRPHMYSDSHELMHMNHFPPLTSTAPSYSEMT